MTNDNESNKIGPEKVVTFHYKLKLDDGQEVDSSEGREPLTYLHGAQNIVPGLEKEMSGRGAGDKFDVTVSPDEGYGPRHEFGVQEIPKEQVPEGVEPGMQLQAQTPDGQTVVLHVKEVRDDVVVVDMNHPLAGENLHFSIDVVDVRDATAEECEHGHPHGPGGHDH